MHSVILHNSPDMLNGECNTEHKILLYNSIINTNSASVGRTRCSACQSSVQKGSLT